MDEFERWKDEYALYAERDITEADCLAAFKAGREAGMREAAGVAEGERDLMTRLGKSHPADSSARDGCFARARSAEHMRYAILSAIGGGK